MGMHTLDHTTTHPRPCTHTHLTLPCLLNIGTKENICILSRPTSFDCSSAAVGNNAQALKIHQGEREFLLEESSKEPTARLFTDWLTDWLNDWLHYTYCSLCILSYLTPFFLQGLQHADGYSTVHCALEKQWYRFLHNIFIQFADYSSYSSFSVRYQTEASV